MILPMTNWREVLSWNAKYTHHKDVFDYGFHWDEDPVTEEMIDTEPKRGEKVTSKWEEVTCPICLSNKVETILYKEHDREAARKRAEFFNQGWASGDYFIHSKTDKGKLYTEIDPDTLEVLHDWT